MSISRPDQVARAHKASTSELIWARCEMSCSVIQLAVRAGAEPVRCSIERPDQSCARPAFAGVGGHLTGPLRLACILVVGLVARLGARLGERLGEHEKSAFVRAL